MYGDAKIGDNVKVQNKAEVFGNAHIYHKSWIKGNVQVYDSVVINIEGVINDDVKIYGKARITGRYLFLNGSLQICGDTNMLGEIALGGNAVIKSNSDYVVFKESWGNGNYFVWTKSNDMWSVGGFYGTTEELLKVKTHMRKYFQTCVDYVEAIKSLSSRKKMS